MRTLKLIRAFADRDFKVLDAIVAGKERKSLLNLYNRLKRFRNNSKEAVNADLFKAAFNKKYTPATDYLLKNELRLLNNIFYDHIAFSTFERYSKKVGNLYNVWLARGLHTKGLYYEFKTEIDRFIAAAQKGTTPIDAVDLMEVKILGLIHHTSNTESHDEINRLVKESEKEQMRYFRYGKRQLERTAACNQMLWHESVGAGNVSSSSPDIAKELSQEQFADAYEEYLLLQKFNYLFPGKKERIGILTRMSEILDNDSFTDHTVFGEKLNVKNNLATSLFATGRFKLAETYLAQAIIVCEERKAIVPIEIVNNMLLAYIYQCKYEDALVFYDKYYPVINKSRFEADCKMLRAYSLLFLHKPKQAFDALPTEPDTESCKLMCRMAYIIALFLNDSAEQAMDDSANFTRMLKSKADDTSLEYALVNNWLKAFMLAMQQGKKQMQEQLVKLKQEIMQSRNKLRLDWYNNCALLWLVRQLELDGKLTVEEK